MLKLLNAKHCYRYKVTAHSCSLLWTDFDLLKLTLVSQVRMAGHMGNFNSYKKVLKY